VTPTLVLPLWGDLKSFLEGLRIEAYFPDVSASIFHKSKALTTSAETSALRRKMWLFHFIIPDAVIFLQGDNVFGDFSWELLISRK
jgi:hypothetical protein